MKRLELLLTFIQVPIDFCLLLLAGITAYSLRYTDLITTIRPVRFDLVWSEFFPSLLLASVGWIIIFSISGMYRVNPNRKLTRDFSNIVLACSTGFAAITVYLFFSLQRFDSRFLILAAWIIAMIYVFLGHVSIRALRSLLYRSGVGLRRTVLIGNESVATTIADTLNTKPQLGYSIIAQFSSFNTKAKNYIAAEQPEEIIFTNPKADQNETLAAIDLANEYHITFKYSADLFDTISSNIAVSTVAGIPIMEIRRTRLLGWGRIFKRFIDIIGSLFFIILFLPLYALCAIAILIETGFPVIYLNERVGQFGRRFFTYKFRSMYKEHSTGTQFGKSGEAALKEEAELIKTNSVKNGPVYKIKNDPRITPVGRFLRSWSLDELPQFINVLIGDMSLVGPRPHQPREVEKYHKSHKVLLAIKPGITGMAQISGRSDLSFEEEARLDTFYVENWSLIMDCVILLKTPFVVLKKTGAW